MSLPPPEPAPEGEVVAFFDMDRTLLRVNSARLWIAFERREGRLGTADALRGLAWMLQYRLGIVDMEAVSRRALGLARGETARALAERCARWYASWVRPTVAREAVARLEAHRTAGHRPVILTASTTFAARPLARELGVDLVATELEVVDGRLTGRAVEPLCYGDGKRRRAEAYCRRVGARLEEAWFYTDSYTDLPVLEAVAHPVAVNPDPRLRRHAERAGWPIVRFR